MRRALVVAMMLFGCGRTAGVEVPKPGVTTQPLRGCEGQTVVALEDRRTLTRITQDGATALFTFGDGLPAEQTGVSHWDVAGRFVAGVAFIGGSPNTYQYEYVLLDAVSGAVKYSARKTEPGSPAIYLGADGSLAIGASTGSVVKPDGSVLELGELIPMTPLLPDGSLIVARGQPWEEKSPKGIWKDGAFTPVTLPSYAALHVAGSQVVYAQAGALVSVLDGKRITLPVSEPSIAETAGVFVLLVSGVEAFVADLEAGTVLKVENVPTPEQRYSAWSAGLQSDGAVFIGVPAGEALQLRRSGDSGATWADVGSPMTAGKDYGLGRWLLARERGGTVMTLSMSTGYGHYVNGLQLTSARGTHGLETGEVYVNVDLLPGAADLSGDGQCAAAWVARSPYDFMRLTFIDAEGKQSVVRTLAEPGWIRFVR